MQGFFSKKETTSESMANGKALTCSACGRFKDCKTPRIQPTGNFKKRILNVFSMPDSVEDRRGQNYAGDAARYLEKVYSEFDVDLDEDCLNTYATICGGEEQPSDDQIINCRRNLMALIKEKKPSVVVVFGESALYSLIGTRWKKDFGKIDKWRGWTIPDQELKVWICPILTPEVAKTNKLGVEELFFKKDLEKAIQKTDIPIVTYKEPEIIYLKNDLSILDSITAGNVAFDYETTGLKPHKQGHQVVCTSVAVSPEKVYVFMTPPTRKERQPFTDLLQRKSVGKIAQNMKFEDTWTRVFFRVQVQNWLYDTMLASHIIENRPNITGLKFQSFVQFGIIDYDSEISSYLKSEDKDGNGFNRILELISTEEGAKKLMTYCALDSIYEYRLANLTRKHMMGTQGLSPISPEGSDFPNAYQLFHQGTLALAEAERQGIRIDIDYCERKKERLTYQIEKLEKKIYDSNFYKHWQHVVKGKVNLNSGDQLGYYLYNVKKIEPKSLTTTGKGSTDEEALKMLNIPELNWIIERGKFLKVRDTYLQAFVREQVDGILHPFFNLNKVQTYRSSSDKPNFQNIPKRDEMSMRTVRQAIYPRVGHQLMEIDYSGIEVAIAACYHKDPTMIKYITDPKSDMHGDMAAQIFKIKNFDRKAYKEHGTLRQAAKNGFVFPQFYGDYYKTCAINMCENWVGLPTNGRWKGSEGILLENQKPISAHLIAQGLTCFADFEEHIKQIEKDFWGKRFPVYTKWKERTYNNYLKNGYVTMYTGFACVEIASKNKVINRAIQGSAFHCLLWSLLTITNRFKELGMKTRIVGQIHDSIILDIYPPELLEVYELVQLIGTKELAKHFKWINVPLEIEAELCGVDESWADKKGWQPS